MVAPGDRQDSISESRKLPQVACKIQRRGDPGPPRAGAVWGGGPTLENFGGSLGHHFKQFA